MKKSNLFAPALVALALTTLASCGGGAGSSSDSKFFGSVPGVFMQMTEKKDALKEQFKNCSSESEAKSIMEDAESAEKEYTAKIEEAAKALDGKTIEIETNDYFRVNSPVALTYDGFRSKSDLTPRFKLAGNIEAAQVYQSENSKTLSGSSDVSRYVGLSEPVYLVGLDDAGNELFTSKIAYFPIGKIADTELGIPAGTPLTFETFTITDKNAEGCAKATKLQLSYKSEK